MNEKKKRRASAQKADTSMQSEQEQPLMAEEPVKADDDAPMEEVEVNQEEAETALIEDGEKPIDYDIDEYLDDPSKY